MTVRDPSVRDPAGRAPERPSLLERIERVNHEDADEPQGPALSVVVRTQARRRHGLLEALTCLAAQSSDDFEVLLTIHDPAPGGTAAVRTLVESFAASFARRIELLEVVGGGRSRPLNEGVAHARGHHVAFLDDDDLVSTQWVQQFVDGIRREPGRVIRCATAVQPIEPVTDPAAPSRAIGAVQHPFPARFNLVDHLYANGTPICSYAVPRAVFTRAGARFSEELDVYEDWALLLDAAMLCGVTDTGVCTSLYRRWSRAEASRHTVPADAWAKSAASIRARLDAEPVLLPAGSAREVIRLVASSVALAQARQRLAIDWRVRSYAQASLKRRTAVLARRAMRGMWRRARSLLRGRRFARGTRGSVLRTRAPRG